jgi:serine phosphatase RsbU (regulator of sigma subunit)
VVADVAGKSIPAALLMATFQASLKTLSASTTSLLELTAGLNRYACAHSQGGLRFTTAFLGELDVTAGRLSYINAGHNAPILRRSSGQMERLTTGGLPLGIQPDATYVPAAEQLRAGDSLFVFTDGMVEAENQVGEEFGDQRFSTYVQALPNTSADAMLAAAMRQLDFFVGNASQHDDMTCLVLRMI